MSTRKGTREGLRFADMTPADILVMADKVKEQGLGVVDVLAGAIEGALLAQPAVH